MSDCLLGGLTNEEARQQVIAYFRDSYTLPYDVIWPNQEPPGLTGRKNPFILLSIVEINKEQEYIGSSDYIIDKFLTAEFWALEYSGLKAVTAFTDFIDSLGLEIVDGIAYRTPESMAPIKFKGWDITPMSLPFVF